MFQEDTVPIRMHLLDFLERQVNKQFVVPVYQRNYTWKKDTQIKQILSDFDKLLEDLEYKHFLGIIIYSLFKSSNLGLSEYSIIDGQQRLSTFFLIMYSLRDLLQEEKNTEYANLLEYQYLINPLLKGDLRLKLKPLISDDNVLIAIVNGELNDLTDEQKKSNVYLNYAMVKEHFKGKVKEGYNIDQIIIALKRFYIVAVPIGSNDNPQQIFESINSTGAKLTAADLIRNYLMMNLQSNQQDIIYTKYWQVLEETLKDRDLESFFRLFLASQVYYLANKGLNIYEQFKKYIAEERDSHDREYSNFDFIVKVSSIIIRYAKYYNDIFFSNEFIYGKLMDESIIRFRRLKTETPAPLLLKFFDLCLFDNLISRDNLTNMINSITNYLFRRLISNQDLNVLSRSFPTLLETVLTEIEQENSYNNIESLFKKIMLNKVRGKAGNNPDDFQLREFVISNHNFYQSKILRFLLDEIENYDNPIKVDLSSLSIEHLLPQTPNKQWLSNLNCDEDTYKDYLNRLGNLTLAAKPDNSLMGNKPFEYKQKILESTNHLNINKKLLSIPTWNFSEIDKRTDEIVDLINKIFPYEIVTTDQLEIYNVCIKQQETYLVLGTFCKDDGSVTVEKDSTFKYYDFNNDDFANESLNYLVESGVIKVNKENDSYTFEDDYTFTSRKTNDTGLSLSASIILGGSRNGKEYWLLENGEPVQTILQDKMKIGTYVYDYFLNAVKDKSISEEMIKNLLDHKYSKSVFNMNYPILIKISSVDEIKEIMKDKNGYNRYWKQPFKFNGNQYLLCSQWVKEQKELFEYWEENHDIQLR